MQKYDSRYLQNLVEQFIIATSKEKIDQIWENIETPVIEVLPNKPDCFLVTFLYREANDKKSIYLWATFTGLPCSSQSKFKPIPDTDIRYLTLALPAAFRSAYNLLIIDESNSIMELSEQECADIIYPVPTGAFKESQQLLMQLFNEGCVQTDPRNKQEMIYYKDYDNPKDFFGKESIIELPKAPPFLVPLSLDKTKAHRWQCKKENRFFEFELNFLETSLKNVSGYYESDEQSTRKYWVYLPPGYDKQAAPYPVIFFLDGSDYLNPMPVPLILDKLIHDGCIPPCIAVFLEYSNMHRMQEYNCHNAFTTFLTHEFIQILDKKNHFNITHDARFMTLVGHSASGLAAFYAVLTNPTVFGNVIALSPALEMQKLSELEQKIEKAYQKNICTHFVFDIGIYETITIDLEFDDGSIQSISSFEANKKITDLMQKKGMLIHKFEFIGGHNYVCWYASLPTHIKMIFDNIAVN